ncbi:MAG: hypothetical protein HUU21_25080, partial [Polyangiaceae bacterium]|nr:hypothetical protein [Polyangiaceae bacterium]
CVNGACVGGNGCDPNAPEVCDGLDNNCNNVADENAQCPDATQMCVNGACVGGNNCPNPSPEVCDGLDNDCDGVVDESAPCPNNSVCVNGICSNCNGANLPEICDGVDNNCNGIVDENASCPNPGQMCVNGGCVP